MRLQGPGTRRADECRPDLVVPRVLDIDFEQWGHPVFLILDVDNTIARLHSANLEQGVVERLASLRDRGVIRDLALVSNVPFGWGRGRRVHRFAEILGAHAVLAGALHLKPSPRPFREALRCMGADPSCTVVVGDQVFTDIRGGNRLGLTTVLVRPLGPDHWTTRWLGRRRRESILLSAMGLAF